MRFRRSTCGWRSVGTEPILDRECMKRTSSIYWVRLMSTVALSRAPPRAADYFDRTAVEAWKRLTSTAPVSRIRATVRAGRDRMRNTLLGYLPADLAATRLLDAGCAPAHSAWSRHARRARDCHRSVADARAARGERLPDSLGSGRIDFRVGDMSDSTLGSFDMWSRWTRLSTTRSSTSSRCSPACGAHDRSIIFTFAPKTPLLTLMWWSGRLFPRHDRAPRSSP